MSTTTHYGWVKPVINGDADNWGNELNADLDGIDSTVFNLSASVPGPATTPPPMDGTAAAGVSALFARADHVHPANTAVAPTNNPVFTGIITMGAQGIAGDTTGTAAPAGSIGEIIAADVPVGGTVPITATATIQNLTSIALTPGDWDIHGHIIFFSGSGTAFPTQYIAGTSTSPSSWSSNLENSTSYAGSGNQVTAGTHTSVNTPQNFQRVTSNRTFYLNGYAAFPGGASGVSMYGRMWARRMR